MKRCWAISPAKTQDKTPQEARFWPKSGPAALFAGKKCPQPPVLKPGKRPEFDIFVI